MQRELIAQFRPASSSWIMEQTLPRKQTCPPNDSSDLRSQVQRAAEAVIHDSQDRREDFQRAISEPTVKKLHETLHTGSESR